MNILYEIFYVPLPIDNLLAATILRLVRSQVWLQHVHYYSKIIPKYMTGVPHKPSYGLAAINIFLSFCNFFCIKVFLCIK